MSDKRMYACDYVAHCKYRYMFPWKTFKFLFAALLFIDD